MIRHGWLLIDKPVGYSSAKIVSVVKRKLGLAKAGHTGTLDPLASGLLPVAIGEATKLTSYLLDSIKVYSFTIRFGSETTTDDLEGEVINTSNNLPTIDEIQQIIPKFIGNITQIPPIYSAIRIDGKRAYELARGGLQADMPPRQITIYELSLDGLDSNEATFKVKASKGTYVRSLARDIARALGTYGHVSELRRLASGKFLVNDAILLENVEKLLYINQPNLGLLKMEVVLDDIPVLAITEQEAISVRYGKAISADLKDANTSRAMCEGELVALGSIENNYFKPKRVFNY
jgi:tRNA pseudouridine55 synthase